MEAALCLSTPGGLSCVSMRALAGALGVTPMALYRHFANKDEVLLAVTDTRLRAQRLPSARVGWRSYLRALAFLLRELLRSDPEIIGLYNRQPVTTASARDRLTTAVEVLVRAGFDEGAAVRCYAAVHTYTLGYCSLEAARGRHLGEPGESVTNAATLIRGFVSDDQFEFGLDVILDGMSVAARKISADP
ncbi:MAG TPA: TetR/AcrR family transcriptional regulator C-terminal domain-containing protein [Acidimicrobiales bacterium]|nr:TetR/AcrR family transcriptional regulator C-terminal domain-containing protein [Acidimicrobiales bacterium]